MIPQCTFHFLSPRVPLLREPPFWGLGVGVGWEGQKFVLARIGSRIYQTAVQGNTTSSRYAQWELNGRSVESHMFDHSIIRLLATVAVPHIFQL